MRKGFIKYTVIALVLFLVGIVNVYANPNIVDFSRKGSIDVTLTTKDDKAIANAGVTIYQVGNTMLKNSNLYFENVEEVNSCGIVFDNINDKDITTSMIKCIQDTEVNRFGSKTNSNGKVSFEDLDLGLYLVVQTGSVKGYANFDAFLVMVPQAIKNVWTYDISATPKTDITRTVDVSVKKVWNNEGSKNPSSVVIELLKGKDVIDSVTLSDKNNWSYTWTDIELSDDYSVIEPNVPENYTATYRANGYDFVVTNTEKLPQTGLELWKVEILAGSGILSLIIGIVLNNRNKYE